MTRDPATNAPNFFLYKYIAVKTAEFNIDPKTPSKGGRLSMTLHMPALSRDKIALWQSIKGSGAVFLPLPASAMNLKLLLTEVNAGGADTTTAGERNAPFTTESVGVGLSAESTTLLWSALEKKGNLGLIADVTLSTPGFDFQQTSEGKWEYKEASRTDRFSVPLDISRDEFPSLFAVINLAQKTSFRYRSMKVMCFDFANETTEGLARVSVEVEITTGRGQSERQTAVFTPRSDPEAALNFKVPERKGGTYRFRVTRIMEDGTTTVDPWMPGDDAVLDVTRYEIEGTIPAEPEGMP